MRDELHVQFHEAEIGYLTSNFLTPEQAETVLAAGEGEKIPLDEIRWVRLERSVYSDRDGRIFRYFHGERGGHGYVLVHKEEHRTGLEHAMRAVTD